MVDLLDEDGNQLIDLEEFVTQMKVIARKRRAKAKADEAIPDWIAKAEANKPSALHDLGWRTLPPDKAAPRKKAQAYRAPRLPRPVRDCPVHRSVHLIRLIRVLDCTEACLVARMHARKARVLRAP